MDEALFLSKLARIEAILDSIDRRLAVQNGRVQKLEDWQSSLKLELARERGRQEGRRDVVLTRGALLAIGAVTASSAGIIKIILYLVGL